MRQNAFDQFEGDDFENRCHAGILGGGGHQPLF